MGADLAARLARVANIQTLRLVHEGRKSRKSYEVTIWFVVEDDTVYLATAKMSRQWPRNVLKRPWVTLRIGGETFTGAVEPITDAAGRAHVADLVGRKYWYARPLIWIGRAAADLGLSKDRSGAFRVRLNTASTAG